jgi:hypothetical protein
VTLEIAMPQRRPRAQGRSRRLQVAHFNSNNSCGFLSTAKEKGHTLSREKENGRLEQEQTITLPTTCGWHVACA